MWIHVAAKQTGRTTKAVETAAAKNAYVVCRDRSAVMRCVEIAKEKDLDIPFPLTFDEFLGGRFNPSGINGFVIDDLDEMTRRLAQGVPVEMVTLEFVEEKDRT